MRFFKVYGKLTLKTLMIFYIKLHQYEGSKLTQWLSLEKSDNEDFEQGAKMSFSTNWSNDFFRFAWSYKSI